MKKLEGILLEIMDNAITGQDIDTGIRSTLYSTLLEYMESQPEDLADELSELLIGIHYRD